MSKIGSEAGEGEAKAADVNQLEQAEGEQVRKTSDESYRAEMTRRAKHHKKWNRRMKIFFCCLGYKKNKDSIADVASIFAEFYANLDVPSSDIAAGFVLLSKYQAAQRQWIVKNGQLGVDQYLSSIPITGESKFLDISTAEDSHLINDLIYYMNYSLAIFGWPMQIVDDPCMLCCICPHLNILRSSSGRKKKVATNTTNISEGEGEESAAAPTAQEKHDDKKKKKCNVDNKELANNYTQKDFCDLRKESAKLDSHSPPVKPKLRQSIPGKLDDDCDMPVILDDNCCGCNAASVERRLRAHNYEIIYFSYKVNVNVVPFLVAADHSKQSIVVAMRGSMSLSDMITDMNGQTDKIPIDDCPDDWLSHRGITRAASYVQSTLIQEHILDRAFNCRPDLSSREYTLVLCGHSLGAGVAAILGVLLRPKYPNLKAHLYSPPGGILSLPAVEYTKQFATGIILGNDCVPRLGVAQLERLRYQVLLSLKTSQESTGKILAKALCPTYCLGGNKVDYDPNQSLNLLYGTEGRTFDYNGCRIPFQVQPQVLYVPGKLIHIIKNHSFKSKARRLFNEPIYQAVWNENTHYDRILINDGMLYDHLPNNLMNAMKMLFSKTLPFRKESKPSVIVPSCQQQQQQVDTVTEKPQSLIVAGEETNQQQLYVSKDRYLQVIVIDDENNNIGKTENKSKNHTLNSVDQSRLTTDNDTQTTRLLLGLNGNDIRLKSSDSSDGDKIYDVNGNDETVPNRNK